MINIILSNWFRLLLFSFHVMFLRVYFVQFLRLHCDDYPWALSNTLTYKYVMECEVFILAIFKMAVFRVPLLSFLTKK